MMKYKSDVSSEPVVLIEYLRMSLTDVGKSYSRNVFGVTTQPVWVCLRLYCCVWVEDEGMGSVSCDSNNW